MSPALREFAPRAPESRRAGDPEHRLQIAQAARALLQVRLEVVGRVVVLEMALLLLERLRLVELPRIHRRGERTRGSGAKSAPRAGDEAMLEQAGPDQ